METLGKDCPMQMAKDLETFLVEWKHETSHCEEFGAPTLKPS